MKAKDFIEKFGILKARKVISDFDKYKNQIEVKKPTHFDADFDVFLHEDDFMCLEDGDVCLSELIQLVESIEVKNV